MFGTQTHLMTEPDSAPEAPVYLDAGLPGAPTSAVYHTVVLGLIVCESN